MSFRRRSMDSMRSVVSWSNFGGTGGIVYAGMRWKAWLGVAVEVGMMFDHVDVILQFRVVDRCVDGRLVDETTIAILTSSTR